MKEEKRFQPKLHQANCILTLIKSKQRNITVKLPKNMQLNCFINIHTNDKLIQDGAKKNSKKWRLPGSGQRIGQWVLTETIPPLQLEQTQNFKLLRREFHNPFRGTLKSQISCHDPKAPARS